MLSQIASVATSIGVLLVVLQLRVAQRERRRSFDDFYVARYWDLMDQFSVGFLRARTTQPTALDALSDDDQAVIYRYLSLAEDQAEMRYLGWVTTATWHIWVDGIKSALTEDPIRTAWNQIRADQPKRFTNLARLEELEWQDPNVMPRWKRWLRAI